jgi:hypothetical protein
VCRRSAGRAGAASADSVGGVFSDELASSPGDALELGEAFPDEKRREVPIVRVIEAR